MKVLKRCDTFLAIPKEQIAKSSTGKWFNWQRTFILQSESKYAVVSLNLFERMARAVFHIDYFKKVFEGKKVVVLSSADFKKLSPTTKKVENVIQNSSTSETKVKPTQTEQTQDEKKVEPKPKQIQGEKKIESNSAEIKLDEKVEHDAERVIHAYRALSISAWIKPIELNFFKGLLPRFEAFKLDKQIQETYRNTDPDKLLVDSKDFGVDEKLLEEFLRYLVITDQIFGFEKTRSFFTLILKDPGSENKNLFTKARLLQIADQMEKVKVPDLSQFPEAERKIGDKVLAGLLSNYYHRAERNSEKGAYSKISVDAAWQELPRKVLDAFVKQGWIDSWNLPARGYGELAIKLRADDLTVESDGTSIPFRWPKWRDRAWIEAEELFKKNNQVTLGEEDKAEVITKTGVKSEDLDNLVKALNKRVAPGEFNWNHYQVRSILPLLKEMGYIHDFQISGPHGDAKLFLKPEDMPTI